jgi:NADPH:quinone reductase-like Zn-dependent oxidoreductase
MKAIQFHEYGTPDVLTYEDVDLPTPAAGQVRIRVAGTSFNSVDGNIRAGFMQEPMPLTLPHTPGLDVAGTVDEVGDGVTAWAVGDEVIGFLPFTVDGAAAEFTLADADGLARAPRSIPLADAAALPLVGLTAWQALFVHADLTAGQRILVTGAAGAVGGYAVQLAAAAGAHVIATASEASAEQVRQHGAYEVIAPITADSTSVVPSLSTSCSTSPRSSPRHSPPWPRTSATVAWSSTRPCGCPPPPTRPAACAASTCTSPATPPSWRRWSSASTTAP